MNVASSLQRLDRLPRFAALTPSRLEPLLPRPASRAGRDPYLTPISHPSSTVVHANRRRHANDGPHLVSDEVTRIRRLEHTVFGNGDIGLTSAVRSIQSDVTTMSASVKKIDTKVDHLEKARAKDENLREGGRRVLIVLGTVISILSGLGATLGWQVLRTVGELARTLP